MRTPSALLSALLLLPLAACTTDEQPDSIATPSGPCAAERVQPPDDGSEQRLQADLDGDGSSDEVVSWVRDGERVVQAWLANGENAKPEALFPGDLLTTADVDGDRRAEVFAGVAATAKEPLGGVFVLDGCRLARVEDPRGPLELVYGTGTDRLQAAATVRCPGQGVLEQVTSTEAPSPGFRLVETTRWVLADGRAEAPTTTSTRVPTAQDPAQGTKGRVACGTAR